MVRHHKWIATLGVMLAIAATLVSAYSFRARAAANVSVQDPATLDRRISMLEQRFYILESTMRRLEQQTAMRPTTIPEQQQTNQAVLRGEIERLKGHIQTLDCAIAKLDERTLAPNLRQSARDESSYKDPCRLNPENPLRLPARP